MQLETAAPTGRGPTARADTIGRRLLVVAALATVAAFVNGVTPPGVPAPS